MNKPTGNKGKFKKTNYVYENALKIITADESPRSTANERDEI